MSEENRQIKVVSELDSVDKFHAHLDTCRQCADHPFDLCPVGDKLLHDAVVYAREVMARAGIRL